MAKTKVIALLVVPVLIAATSGEKPAVTPASKASPGYNWTGQADPPSKPYYVAEPTDEEQRVYRCWGYLARGKATGEMREYLINGTLPTSNTCDGVNRLHPDCWPSMFTKVFPQTTQSQLQRLRLFCNKNGTVPAAEHFAFA